MTPEQIDIFNHNVHIDNNATELLVNISTAHADSIGKIIAYLDDITFIWSLWFFVLALWTLVLSIGHTHVEKRIEELEDNRPEKEPLLSNF
jgi:hypothetical protein